MLWEVEIVPAPGEIDREGEHVLAEAERVGARTIRSVRTGRAFLIEGPVDSSQIEGPALRLLADSVVEQARVWKLPAGDAAHPQIPVSSGEAEAANGRSLLLNVLFKPGVTDNVGHTAAEALQDLGLGVERVATCRKYWVNADADAADIARLSAKVLSNDAIEHVIEGPLQLESIALGSSYEFHLRHIPIRHMDDAALQKLSKEGQLYLSLAEMQTIRQHFVDQNREPTDIELETVAQTWSEHCSHKTLAGRIAYRDENGERRFENMLKETIFAATQTIRKQLGQDDWCISVFKDNAGIVTFNDEFDVCIKVETHNHPSALEPYGGANTGLGGVIRDPLGTGLGARPVCNTDVFCFAPPDTPYDSLPPGVLHPNKVMHGVVAGVRDYGNRMGIPTVNGAVFFDERYIGNPLVYCGNVALIPRGKSEKQVHPGDFIVAVGGRTGRDGIHGATFSSAELTHESEELSGGAVQIGNAITEKMVLDVILEARDRNLYHAITDCGAGGFSSAVGEMGEQTGAEVWLDKAPLKYSGLSYTEIWISEAQERMVLAVPPEKWDEFRDLCASEGVEATVIGEFTDTHRLILKYADHEVGNLGMAFLHDGRPPVVREAVWESSVQSPVSSAEDRGSRIQDSWEGELQNLGSVSGETMTARRESRRTDLDVDVATVEPAAEILDLLPASIARQFDVLPVATHGDELVIATPEDLVSDIVDRVEFITNRSIRTVVAARNDIRAAITRLYPSEPESSGNASTLNPQRSTPSALDSGLLTLDSPGNALHAILASLNVCSKEWIIRQYDHEVQAGSVVKPLVGVKNDGPSDAAVVQPDLKSQRGLVIACGMNPRYGDLDPYWMAASAIDEAVRNCIAVGADPSRIAILDNFCWGNTERPETLGSLVRAALACQDVAIAYGTPFVSGKDSLNNEFTYESRVESQESRARGASTLDTGHSTLNTISIPPSLLITALGQIENIERSVTMDLKEAGNVLFLVGRTANEFGGSHLHLVTGGSGGEPPRVDLKEAPRVFAAMHQAITKGLVRSCHDLSEGGLAVALAEMAFAGGLGVDASLAGLGKLDDTVALFSESNTRFLVEVPPESADDFAAAVPFSVRLGTVTDTPRVVVKSLEGRILIDESIDDLKASWQHPLANE